MLSFDKEMIQMVCICIAMYDDYVIEFLYQKQGYQNPPHLKLYLSSSNFGYRTGKLK
jgi:hypothetical protein